MGWEFKILGTLEVQHDGETVKIAAAQQRALLTALLIDVNQVVSTDQLIDCLWDAHPPATALTTLHSLVRRLRRALEGPARPDRPWQTLVWQPPGYQLCADPQSVDLTVFDSLLTHGRDALFAGQAGVAARDLHRALALWRGPALLDIKADGLRRRVLPRLEEAHLAATELCAQADLQLGRHPQVVPQLRRLAAEHPLREQIHRLLIEALRGSGRRAEALAAYQTLRRSLVDELGVEPDAATQQAHQLVLGSATGKTTDEATDENTVEWTRPAQLPIGVPDFVGRTAQLRKLTELAQPRHEAQGVTILAISGPPGVGKSALALRWAHEAATRFPDGQLFVDLRGYGPAAAMPPVVALARLLRSMGLPADQVPADAEDAAAAYRTLVYGRRLLIVLDNALDANQVEPLLPGSPGSVVLVTSRRRLTDLTIRFGARCIPLHPMLLDEATTLLLRMIEPDPRGANTSHLAELAQVCGFFPLALRLAGARLAELPQQAVAEHVAQLASDTGRGLLGGFAEGRTAVAQAFEFSYSALSEPLRQAFRLLCLVPGDDFTSGEAAALADASPAHAAQLLAGLAMVHLIEEREPGRYALHDLLRLFALSCAQAEDDAAVRAAAQGRLLDWYLARADAAAKRLYPQMLRLPGGGHSDSEVFADNSEALAWLDAQRANIVAAIRDCAGAGPHRPAWLLADAMRGYFDLRRHLSDFSLVAQAALDAAECCGDEHAKTFAHRNAAHFHYLAARPDQAVRSLEAALAASRRAGWVQAEVNILSGIGAAQVEQGDLPAAVQSLQAAHVLARSLDDPVGEGNCLDNLGEVYFQWGRPEIAASHYQQALSPYQRSGSDSGQAHALVGLAVSLLELGRGAEAQTHAAAALARYRKVGNVAGELQALRALAAIHTDAADLAAAANEAAAALELARRTRDRTGESAVLVTLGTIELSVGALERAEVTFGQALELATGSGARYQAAEAHLGLATARRLQGQASPADAQRALAIAGTHQFAALAARARLLIAGVSSDRS